MTELSHLDEDGEVHMVDVGAKAVTRRRATARCVVIMGDHAADAVAEGSMAKGDVLATVRVAAIQGVKRTADLIPLCHPLPVDSVEVDIERTDIGFEVTVTVSVQARTGVEMEAMTGAAIGGLTMYDMVKGVDRSAGLGAVELLAKSGGRSGEWTRG